MRRGVQNGFTLVEVLIALALSAAIFAAALNLLLGIATAWERAREGDLRADEDYRLFAYLRNYLESAPGEDGVRVENLPGQRGDYWLTFPIEGSPLTRALSEEWRTDRFAMVRDRDGIRLLPVVGEDDERPRDDDGLLIVPGEVEVVYWIWEENRDRWDEREDLESRGGQQPELPQYVVFRFADGTVRWAKIPGAEGGQGLW